MHCPGLYEVTDVAKQTEEHLHLDGSFSCYLKNTILVQGPKSPFDLPAKVAC